MVSGPSPDPHAPSEAAQPPGSGPADVPVGQLAAARRGDSAAFARFVTHWNPHVRAFVHLILAGEGDTDRVLSATYLRAYRALPRYEGEPAPGLWLLRTAYLAATDELRRQSRDPRSRDGSRRARPESGGDDVTGEDAPLGTGLPAGWRSIGPDQRALIALVDRIGFDAGRAAIALDSPTSVVDARLDAGRRALSLAHGTAQDTLDENPALAETWSREAVGAIEVPDPTENFWPMLGKRLLAEQESPAAPTPNPRERLRSHPAQPGFRPRPLDVDPVEAAAAAATATAAEAEAGATVTDLAEQAEKISPGRSLGPVLLVVGLVIATLAVLAVAITYGTSSTTVAGSIANEELGARISGALAANSPTEVEVRVQQPARPAEDADRRYRVTYAPDGSWFTGARQAIEAVAYDAPSGSARRVAAVGAATGDPTTLAAEDRGLSTGAPDTTDQPPAFLGDLQLASTLLRADPEGRAAPTSEDGVLTYTARRTVRTGPGGSPESWEIEVRRGDHRPIRIERRSGERLVRRTVFRAWRTVDEVPPDRFLPAIPDGVDAESSDAGFLPAGIDQVTILGRGPAVTPSWLPDGYRLAAVRVRRDGQIASLGFQRGPERFTITTRAIASSTRWADPFTRRPGDSRPTAETLRSGHFNGATVRVVTGAAGDARLWGAARDDAGPTGFTVAGDLTATEARRVAASLR